MKKNLLNKLTKEDLRFILKQNSDIDYSKSVKDKLISECEKLSYKKILTSLPDKKK